ncbi:MAG: hypothetical protein EXR79_09030 [Myxococcales bacterium]|nr:hypothetical protein [Myxococcales bacterium]
MFRAPRFAGALFICGVLALGCSVEPPAAQVPGAGGGTEKADASVGGDASGDGAGGTGDAAGAGVDTISVDVLGDVDVAESGDATATTGDGGAGDTTAADDLMGDAVADTGLHDTAPDGVATDAAKDTTVTDTAKDTVIDSAAGWKCLSDTDCKGVAMGACWTPKCNANSGSCELAKAADDAVCTVKGLCGGPGTCAAGACKVTTASCAPAACEPAPIKCGDTVKIDLATLGASKFKVWLCSGIDWEGGEKGYLLPLDATGTVKVELAQDGTPSAMVVSIPGPSVGPGPTAGQCNPTQCDAVGKKLVFGVSGSPGRAVYVETLKGAVGSVTLSVSCTVTDVCGDKVCAPNEKCSTCMKDCGACSVCGDGKCDLASGENCTDCDKDCGACPTECKQKKPADPDAKGCTGCACEKCVCAQDGYCCNTAWDSLCVGACETKCGGPKCGAGGFCGDDDCEPGVEDATTCPNDCATGKCGDGKCTAPESCDKCTVDCGFCTSGPTAPTCGNGKCDGKEHCGSCPQDCGACGDVACVCAADPYCCKTAYDSTCQNACANCAGGACPKPTCGDGSCDANEKCSSCAADCGPCPPTCGDFTCTAPVENLTTCAKDCAKCGDSVCSAGIETCKTCLKDCGECPPECGDAKCNGTETLETCPKDCAKCGDAKCSAPNENCKTCDQDCGACVCGDGQCDDPKETFQTCPADCAGCQSKCGKSSKNANGSVCWCDGLCEAQGDCCDDKKQFCP